MAEIEPNLDVAQMQLPQRPWVAVVGNPFSGSGRNRREAQRMTALLEQRSIPSLTIWDRQQRQQLFAHPQMNRACIGIVIAGGDGTVAEVMAERPTVPLAVLPLGNENLVAKEYGFTTGAEPLVDAILRGEHRPLDLGCIAGRSFSLMLSVGLDAEIVHRVAAWRLQDDRTKRIGHRSYVRPSVAAMWCYRYPTLTLEADGRRVTGALAMVFNLPRYAMNLPFASNAVGDDGELDWVVFEKPGVWCSLGYGLDVWCDRHRRREDVHTGRATSIRITSDSPAPIQIDGDPCEHTPVAINVAKHAVRMIVA